MPLYKPTKSPSERTVEGMANHWLLNALGSVNSWIFAPTQNEELGLGFDGQLVGSYKAAFIQYKGTRRITRGVAFDIDAKQRKVLQAVAGPDAYYGACSFPDYTSLAAAFASTPPTFFPACYFIEASALKVATRTVRIVSVGVKSPPKITMHGKHGVLLGTLSPSKYWPGPDFASQIKACSIGSKIATEINIRLANMLELAGRKRSTGLKSLSVLAHRLQ